MNIDKKRIGAVASAAIAVGILAGGSIAFASTVGAATPADEPDRSTISRTIDETPEPEVTPTETPTPTPEPVVEEPAPAEPAPVVEEPAAPAPVPAQSAPQQPAAPAPAPAPEPPAPAPAPPVYCPGGSVATESDGYNDTACMPEVCFSIEVPNPEHPECDRAFRP